MFWMNRFVDYRVRFYWGGGGGCNKGFSWEKRCKRYTAEEPRGCGGPVATGVLHSPLTVAPVT